MKKWKVLSTKNDFSSPQDIISQLLLLRGITTKEEIEDFLHPDLSKISLSFVGLDKKAVEKALKRIEKAIEKNEKIIVYGDYDVDGISGTAILWETLYQAYKNVIPYIPDRFEEGYGLSKKGIENILRTYDDVGLIITVDNGIVASKAVDFANEKGIDVIVTDHHTRGKKDPDAFAIVHTTKLCGAGVAYMLSRSFDQVDIIKNKKHLELVALATIADLVPLTYANRILAIFGIKELSRTKRPGLLELFRASGIQKEKIGAYEIGFIIGPRINAMGRIASGLDSLRFLCTSSAQRAVGLASALEVVNKDRQSLTQLAALHAKEIFSREKSSVSKIVFVSHTDYNQGVIGLVASKLVEAYYRPSFVLSVGEKYAKGSARSITGVNIIEMIRSASTYLVEAGGHPMAAGFTVETEKIEYFKKELEEAAEKVVTEEHLQRTLLVDMPLAFSAISFDLCKHIQKLAPFGVGNDEPIFVTPEVYISDLKYMGKEKNHLKLWVEKDGFSFEAVLFGFKEKLGENIDLRVNDKIDIAYTVGINEWNGSRKINLMVKDIKIIEK